MKRVVLGLMLMVSQSSHSISVFKKLFSREKCETRLSIVDRPVSEGEKLSMRILGLLDQNHPYRESQVRFLHTVRDVKTYEMELDRVSKDYDKLVPELTKSYEAFTKTPNPTTKQDLEVALLQVEILLDQIKELCLRLQHAVAVRVQELRTGLIRRPDVMRQVPPELVEQLKNPSDLLQTFKAIAAGNRLSQLEVAVMEEFNMMSFFVGLRDQIRTTMEEGFAPLLQEKIKAVNFALGRSSAQGVNANVNN